MPWYKTGLVSRQVMYLLLKLQNWIWPKTGQFKTCLVSNTTTEASIRATKPKPWQSHLTSETVEIFIQNERAGLVPMQSRVGREYPPMANHVVRSLQKNNTRCIQYSVDLSYHQHTSSLWKRLNIINHGCQMIPNQNDYACSISHMSHTTNYKNIYVQWIRKYIL